MMRPTAGMFACVNDNARAEAKQIAIGGMKRQGSNV